MQQRKGDRLERRDHEGRAHDGDDARKLGRMEEAPQRDRRGTGDGETAHPDQHRETVDLGHLLLAQVAKRDHGGSQTELAHQGDQSQVDRRHPHEAVVLGSEESGHNQRRGPGEELASPLCAARPGDSMHQRAVQLAQVRSSWGCRQSGGAGSTRECHASSAIKSITATREPCCVKAADISRT